MHTQAVHMHPRRRSLLAFVHDNPGAGFREIARKTGIPPGTARHHLTILMHSGMIVELPHGNTKRFFANDEHHEESWSTTVLLRDPALAVLHAWLKDNRMASQRHVIEAMQRNRWSRSTTQHRLQRLVTGGAASIQLQGGLRLYSAIPTSASWTLRESESPIHLHASINNNHQGPEPGAWRRNAQASRVPPMASAPTFLRDASVNSHD
ncbi:MAG: helix-turn-helix domain-containing protein [Thermoplasmatota archaeon]